MNVSNDIAALINKHLPAAVGAELQSVLAQAEKDKAQVGHLSTVISAQEKELDDLRRTLREVGQLSELREKIVAREAEVSQRERDFKVSTLEVKLAAEERVGKVLAETLAGLVRNTEWRSSISGTENIVVSGSGGTSWISQQPSTKSTVSSAS